MSKAKALKVILIISTIPLNLMFTGLILKWLDHSSNPTFKSFSDIDTTSLGILSIGNLIIILLILYKRKKSSKQQDI